VPGGGEQLKPRARDGRGVGATVAGVGDLVAVTPDNDGGNGDAGQAGRQAGVAHGGAAVDGEGGAVARHDGLLLGGHRGRIDTERIRVVIAQFGDLVQRESEEVDDGVIRDIDTHRVDQHDAADSGGAEQGHLGRDPAADGVSDDGHVPEVEFVEQGGVQRAESADGGQRLGAGCRTKAGVGGGDESRRFLPADYTTADGRTAWLAADQCDYA
jgi:hypothetical protein